MADEGELDLNHEGNISGDGFGVRKNIALKLKPSPKGKRGRKSTKQKKEEIREEDVRHNHGEYGDEEVQLPIMKGPPEPQHKNKKLHWDHKVHLIGERVVDPLIHCCEKCALPILIYGRMIPCKHVFCLDCAKKAEKSCPRCNDAVQRIEQAALGTVFVCTHGGAKHGVSGCRRTYLSNRDLQAHIQYRHLKDHSQPPPQQQPAPVVIQPVTQQNLASAGVSHNQPIPNQQAPAQGVMPPQRQEYPPLSIGVSMPGIMPQQQGQPLSSNHTAVYPDQLHGLPQSFTSPPPPQQPLTSHGGPLPAQGIVGPPQTFHQPPSTAGAIESYQTVGQGGNSVVPGRGSNLIPVVMQDEGGFNPGMPPPGYIPGAPPPQRNYPPVSFAGNTGGPPPQMLVPPPLRGGPGHLPPRQGPPPQNTHGIQPRYPGQNPPFSQSGPGGPLPRPGPGGPRTWQGPGPGGPPQRPPPQNQRGPNPSRY